MVYLLLIRQEKIEPSNLVFFVFVVFGRTTAVHRFDSFTHFSLSLKKCKPLISMDDEYKIVLT